MDCYTNVLYLVGEKKQKTYEQNRFTVLKYGYQLEFRIVDYVAKKKKNYNSKKSKHTMQIKCDTLYGTLPQSAINLSISSTGEHWGY